MVETPFNLLLRRERERRLQLIGQIQQKDLRQRAISYNLRIHNSSHQDSPKHTIREQFGNPSQKTRVCKKLMSNSLHRHSNSEEFHHFKETMVKG